MSSRGRVAGIWLVALGLLALMALPLWRPFRTAWHCYAIHAGAERERAEVLHKLENATFVLRLVEGGPGAGRPVVAPTGPETR